jgi:hypothetical protein
VLTIRHEQIRVLSGEARRRFLDEAVAHVSRYFGQRAAATGPVEIAAAIDAAVARRIVSRTAVLKYVNLTVILGPHFEARLPWAAAYLDDEAVEDVEERVTRLHEEVIRRLETRGTL